jgi:hypothetical protein
MLVGFLGIIVTIIIAVTPNSQRLGDLAAGTIVIQTQIKSSLNDTIFQEVSQKNHQVMYPEVMRLSDRDINTIKSVLTYAHKKQGALATRRIAEKIQQALVIQTKLTPVNFLEQLLADYNYLATKE